MMAGILGYSELLMLQCDPDGVSHAHLQSIIGNGERAAAILQDVLILSLGEAGGRKPVNLNDLIVAFLEKPEFQSITKRREESSVRMDLEMSLHDVFASAAKLEKAVASLLYISFARAGAQGAVSIATKTLHLGRPAGGNDNICEGEYVVLSVTDSGDGIPDEFASHLFEPFYVKKVMRHGVTGLELPIVREVVKEHDGFIDVYSKKGSGTTFTVYLPVLHGKPQAGHHLISPDFPDAPASMN
jgi:signal transduction histidine kinase